MADFIQTLRILLASWRTRYRFAFAVVCAGLAVDALALLAHRITAAEFVAIAGLFVLLGPFMIVARELHGGGLPGSDRAA
jgi:hypothetical protein